MAGIVQPVANTKSDTQAKIIIYPKITDMHTSLSKKWAGIDFKVWLSLLVLAALSIALLGYKVATNTPCIDFIIKAQGKLNHPETGGTQTFYVNEQITFTTSVTDSTAGIIWNFDDGTEKKAGLTTSHVFNVEGYFLVKALLNGKCLQSFNVRITQSNIVHNMDAPAISPIISADIISVGDEAVFNTSAIGANYEWSVEELPGMPAQSTPTAKFIFTQPGTFTVLLKVAPDGVYKKIVQVTEAGTPLSQAGALPPVSPSDLPPLPQEPLPLEDKKPAEEPKAGQEAPVQEVPAAPTKVYDQLPEPAIKAMLQGVIDGKKNLEDFNTILCNGAGTKVMANNESTTFAALCNELKEKKGVLILKKKRKIESFKVVRDETNGNCVKIIFVQYK